MLGRLCRRTQAWSATRCFALAADAVQNAASTSKPSLVDGESQSLRVRLSMSEHEVADLHARVGNTIELDKSQLKEILGSADNTGKLAENMDLLKAFGFSNGDQKSLLMRSPIVFTTDKEKLEKFWGYFLKEYGFENSKLKRMVLFYPKVLEVDFDEVITPSLEAFLNMGFTKEQIVGVVLDYPQGLLKFGTDLEEALVVFREGGLSKDDFIKLVCDVPHTLRGSLDEKRMLISELMANGMSREETRVVLMECESLTSESYEKNLKPKMQFLENMGIPKLTIVHKIIKKAGYSFSRTRLDTMKESYRCLVSLGISQDMYKEMVCKTPFILGQGPASLKEKIDFVTEVMKRDILDVARFPSYLTYSLERRILYRAAIKLSTGEDLNSVSLRNLMIMPHAKFCGRYKPEHIDRLTQWWEPLTKEEKWKAVETRQFLA